MVGRGVAARLGLLVVAVIGAAVALAFANAASAAEIIVSPTADATVRAALPTLAGGTGSKLSVDGSPEIDAYLRFDVAGLDGAVTSATLQLYALSPQRLGVDAHAVADASWDERTLTYATAPAFDPNVLGSSGRAVARTWMGIDVTSSVVGDGSYGFALTTDSPTRLAIASRQYGNGFEPHLVIETSGVPVAPTSVNAPTISGTASAGAALTAKSGDWDGSPPFSYSYQWLRCDAAGATCQTIDGANAATYSPTADDVGSTLRVSVLAANGVGSASATSSATAVVTGAGSPGTTACGTAPSAPTYHHVIWILMENHSARQLIGSSQAPYINQLAQQCGLATNYFAVAHPSLPNYIALTSGDTQGITNDGVPPANVTSADNLFAQIAAAGESWRVYAESMPSNCVAHDSGSYSAHHNPAIYYSDLAGTCAANDVPLGTTSAGALADALANASLPSFAFVVPNLISDMHNGTIAQGDDWLSTWIPAIIASPAYQAGDTAVFVTWDEDDNSARNEVPLLVISPSTDVGTTVADAFDHYSLLQTTEQLLGLPLLGHAGDASTASLAAPFGLTP